MVEDSAGSSMSEGISKYDSGWDYCAGFVSIRRKLELVMRVIAIRAA